MKIIMVQWNKCWWRWVPSSVGALRLGWSDLDIRKVSGRLLVSIWGSLPVEPLRKRRRLLGWTCLEEYYCQRKQCQGRIWCLSIHRLPGFVVGCGGLGVVTWLQLDHLGLLGLHFLTLSPLLNLSTTMPSWLKIWLKYSCFYFLNFPPDAYIPSW